MRAHLADFCVRFGWSLACAVCVACTPAERGPLAGASDSWRNAPSPAATSPAPPSAPWPWYVAAQSWPTANAAPFPSRGHQPAALVDVRANDVARPSYASLVTDSVFPDGSVLFEQAHSSTSGSPGYAMSKQSGRWSFIQLGAHGEVMASGTLALCAGCHAQAPADQVFGLPRDL